MDRLEDIIRTLSAIEVHGKTNLAMLLGCITALEQIQQEQDNGRQTNK